MKNGFKITPLMIGLLVLLFILPAFLFSRQEHEKIVDWRKIPGMHQPENRANLRQYVPRLL